MEEGRLEKDERKALSTYITERIDMEAPQPMSEASPAGDADSVFSLASRSRSGKKRTRSNVVYYQLLDQT